MLGGGQDALHVLLDLTRRLAEPIELEAQLQATTDAALAILPGDHASLRLFDEGKSELLSSARSGTGVTQPPATFRRGQGVVGAVAESGRSTLVPDALEDPRFVAYPTQGFEVRAVIAVPLVAGGEVIGVLSVSSARTGAFGPEDRDLAQLIANCAVPAIEKSRLGRLAITDWLTRAYNHRYLAPRLEEEVERARRHAEPLSLALLDLDHFKRVNDAHGHDAGDAVLRAFVDRVRAEVRRHDVVVRRGGEEFVLIMPETGAADAFLVAERVRARVSGGPIALGEGRETTITVSIGIATWRGERAQALEQRADAALYRAKGEGRDRVIVDLG
ncbi:diguanylate cyclase [Sandaracinus amylolyticus]|uniref:diguanylate cyclase n=1 Tax=Sandaracinus amylolyticus TaxID=927083 RepID=A0A0F6YJE9_9BACT|nr:diguanylate cyclase [Sandaracinus amylolyticus]AKF06020.1 diguanylate cyclase/phosphodiesterase (GGDEF & EAL domains) with PAS/PAC sensor(s) [Sandaracinus amylolyticus]